MGATLAGALGNTDNKLDKISHSSPRRVPMRIVLCYDTKPCHLQKIASVVPGAEIVDASQEEIARETFSADVFCGHAKVPIDWDGVVRQGRLRWIQSSAAGIDHCLVPSAVIDSEILVTSAWGPWPTRWPSTRSP